MIQAATQRCIVSVQKAVLTELRRMHFTLNGTELQDPSEKETWIRAYSTFWCMCSELLNWSSQDCLRQIKRTAQNPYGCEIKAIIGTLSEADSFMLQLWENQGKQLPWNEFKAHFREGIWVNELVYMFKPVYSCSYLRRKDDYVLYQMLRSCLVFLTRITLQGDVETLESAVFDSWRTVDEALPDSYSSEPKKFFDRYVRSFDASWLRAEDVGFSNGSCADANRSLYWKYMAVGQDSRTEYMRKHYGIALDWADDTAQSLKFDDQCLSWDMFYEKRRQLRISKAMTVPKNFEKRRGINMEPAHLNALQKCGQHALYRWLRWHPHLKKHIALEDASQNTALAQVGSEFGYYCTIDISSASDRITKTMLKTWLGDCFLYRLWLLTKSDAVYIPTSNTIWTPKRAFSMGSALCFPIETLCYAAMTEQALEETGIDPRLSAYRVYGDDIIVEKPAAERLIEILEANGCEVNRKKTFCGTREHIFRESCGGEYLDGFDVTPVRISRRFSCESWNSTFQGEYDLANRLFWLFHGTRSALVKDLISKKRYAPLFTDDFVNVDGLLSYKPDNFHLPVRWSSELMASFWVHNVLVQRQSEDTLCSRIVVQEVLRRMEIRGAAATPDTLVLSAKLPWFVDPLGFRLQKVCTNRSDRLV